MPLSTTYADVVERFLQRLANEGRSPRTLEAYRADLDDTMVSVAAELDLLPTRPRLEALDATERERAVLAAFDALDLREVTLDHLGEDVTDLPPDQRAAGALSTPTGTAPPPSRARARCSPATPAPSHR